MNTPLFIGEGICLGPLDPEKDAPIEARWTYDIGFAFEELNLFRVTLSVFEYNQRAIRSYENNGFLLEGKERAALLRDGKRRDLWIMGLLRDEWKGGRYGDPDP